MRELEHDSETQHTHTLTLKQSEMHCNLKSDLSTLITSQLRIVAPHEQQDDQPQKNSKHKVPDL